MNPLRKPLVKELALIKLLVQKANLALPIDWHIKLCVQLMKDGGMGSLLLLPDGITTNDRKIGKRISEYQFQDADGVQVIASLNLDTNGHLYELDLWKTDFSPLIRYPEE